MVTFVMEVTIVNSFVVKNSKFISCFLRSTVQEFLDLQEKLPPKRTIHTIEDIINVINANHKKTGTVQLMELLRKKFYCRVFS